VIAFFFFFFFFPTFSERLSDAMEKVSMGTSELAALASVSPHTVKRWLNGTFEPRHGNLIRLADTLDVSADFLCGRS